MCQKTTVFVLGQISGFPGPQISQIWPGPGQAWTLGVGVRCWLLNQGARLPAGSLEPIKRCVCGLFCGVWAELILILFCWDGEVDPKIRLGPGWPWARSGPGLGWLAGQ